MQGGQGGSGLGKLYYLFFLSLVVSMGRDAIRIILLSH